MNRAVAARPITANGMAAAKTALAASAMPALSAPSANPAALATIPT